MTGVGPGAIPDVFAELDGTDDRYEGELVADGGFPVDGETMADVNHSRDEVVDYDPWGTDTE